MSTKLERLLHMDALIRDGSYHSKKTFMDRFEVSERTIHNDIQFLRNRLNAPLGYKRSYGGYFYTDTNWKLPAFFATEGQLSAFFLSVELAHLPRSILVDLRKAARLRCKCLPSHQVA